jgi:hypothetical protein
MGIEWVKKIIGFIKKTLIYKLSYELINEGLMILQKLQLNTLAGLLLGAWFYLISIILRVSI